MRDVESIQNEAMKIEGAASVYQALNGVYNKLHKEQNRLLDEFKAV